jgi:CDP-glucose 4,6-dehydratase
VNLLDALRRVEHSAACVVVTSDKCYENREVLHGYHESDALGGHDPYSASKGAAEIVAHSYRRSYFMSASSPVRMATARAGNVIGGGDWAAERLLPDAARAWQRGAVLELRRPEAVRPWQHVLEPVIGYLSLGMHLEKQPLEFSQAYNFGPETQDTLSVEEVVKEAIKSWGFGQYINKKELNQPHEAGLLKLDISKVKLELNWVPKLNAKETIKITFDWYKNFNNNKLAIIDFTTNQILSYLDA